jgi:hypothetical protein
MDTYGHLSRAAMMRMSWQRASGCYWGRVQAMVWDGGLPTERIGMSSPRQKKTARELAEMIGERMGAGAFIAVHKDSVYGWHPRVMTTLHAVALQHRAEEIAKELRAQYDLSEWCDDRP